MFAEMIAKVSRALRDAATGQAHVAHARASKCGRAPDVTQPPNSIALRERARTRRARCFADYLRTNPAHRSKTWEQGRATARNAQAASSCIRLVKRYPDTVQRLATQVRTRAMETPAG